MVEKSASIQPFYNTFVQIYYKKREKIQGEDAVLHTHYTFRFLHALTFIFSLFEGLIPGFLGGQFILFVNSIEVLVNIKGLERF